MKTKIPPATIVTRHVGLCQICEVDHKATEGGIVALHGYRRPGDGYVVGRCDGAGELAYERSCVLLPPRFEGAKRTEATLRETLRKIDAGEVASFFARTHNPKKPLVEIVKSDVEDWTWRTELKTFRGRVERDLRMEERDRKHLEARVAAWTLRPLREVDELGRTPEQREAKEARGRVRQAARDDKQAKTDAFAQVRGQKLVERKRLLDASGRLLREAAAKDGQEGALRVLQELGKKKHRTLLEPSFAIYASVADLRRRGTIPRDLPDVGDSKEYEWSWEHDLGCDDVLLALGLARPREGRTDLEYNRALWVAR